jgi:CRP/FNR family transcriptional regulator, carbon monoxide oxidation system transcription regulator
MFPIRQMEPFSRLSEDQWTFLRTQATQKTFSKKETIFHSDEQENYFIIILTGQVKVYLSYPNGKEFTLGLLKQGDLYPTHAHVNAKAITPATVWVITWRSMQTLLIEEPSFLAHLFPIAGQLFGNAIEIIHSLVFTDVRERLAIYLLKNKTDYRTVPSSETFVSRSLTMNELANLLGSSRQTVSTILNQWHKDGIIHLDRDYIKLTHPDELQKIAFANE